MAQWSYRCYDDGRLQNLWQRWYEQHPEANGSHDHAFDILETQDRWLPPLCKQIKGRPGLMEVRVLHGAVQWRVFGYFPGGTRWAFTVVAVGNHKGVVYDPKGILATAEHRMIEIKSGKKEAHPCERPE